MIMDGMTSGTAWRDIGRLDEVPCLGSRVVATPRGKIAVFRTRDDRVFALEDRCPHNGGPLSQGIVHGNHVTCPLHNWVIALATGEAVAPDIGCAPTIPTQVRQDRILLLLPYAMS
ncbi:MAG: nirD [Rhodospirillales bacterium]|nr:nirD [Rhodospirillales bacterium]